MANIRVCRVCLAHDTRMCLIANTKLQDFYEKNIKKPFNNQDGRSSVVCYICYHLLKKCHKFVESAIKGDEVLQQMYNSGTQITEKSFTMVDKTYLFANFKQSPIMHETIQASENTEIEIPIENSGTQVKQELLDMDCQEEIVDASILLEPIINEFEIKMETTDKAGMDEEKVVADPLLSQKVNHNPEPEVPLKSSLKRPRNTIPKKIGPKRKRGQSYAEFREIILSKEEQKEQLLQKAKTLNYAQMLYKCDLCYKGFMDQAAFSVHKKKHDEMSGAFECDICHIRYRTKRQFLSHSDVYHRKQYACNKCSHRCQTLVQAKQHQKFQHEAEGTGAGIESKKYEQFHSQEILGLGDVEADRKVIGDPLPARSEPEQTTSLGGQAKFTCNYCGHINTNLNNLLTHLKTHTRETPLICNYCGKTFTQTSHLNEHLRIHTGEKPFTCNHCGKKITTKSNFKKHLRTHTDKRVTSGYDCGDLLVPRSCANLNVEKLVCNYCGKVFKNEVILSTHVRRLHRSVNRFVCDYCGKSFPKKATLVSHLSTGKKLYACNYCAKSFLTKCNFKLHLRTHTGEKSFTCKYCQYQFYKLDTLIQHVRKHTDEKLYTCNYCGENSKKKSRLIRHIRIHTGEMPYTCNYCGNKFKNITTHINHMRIHTGEKPFVCDYCGKKFARKTHLKEHIRIHTGEKPFKCVKCKKMFISKTTLNKHFKTHSGVKPYKCNICGRVLARSYSLRAHMKTHTGEKPFPCNFCGKFFSRRTQLTSHLRTHTGEKPFKCNYCEKGFSEKKGLTKHMISHTVETPEKKPD